MAFRPFITPHCHPGSLDTASKPESFIEWEIEHGTGFVTATDHGTLDTARKLYDLAGDKRYKGKITPIMGLEAYLRDDSCPILKSFGIEPTQKWKNVKTGWWVDADEFEEKVPAAERKGFEPFFTTMDYQKYFHLTLAFQDQKAYETVCRLLSAADARAERHGSANNADSWKPLFTWAQLEEIGAENVTFGSSCLIGMVQRHIAFGERYDIAEAYYKKLRSLVRPGNFIVEAFPHVCEQNWESRVVITLEDDSTISVPLYRKILTDQKYGKGTGIKAEYLAERWERSKEGHGRLRALMFQRKWQDVEKQLLIKNVEKFERFIKNECTTAAPDGDIQRPANLFVLEMAKKYGDKILISDDSHFVKPEEKVVQDVKLLQDGSWRFANSYHRLSSEEAWPYFRDRLGIDQATYESWIDNSYAWAEGFKGMKLKPRNVLPTKFYPENTLVHTFRLIQKHGRQAILQNPVYWNRLQAEIELLHRNGVRDWLPYFMIDEEVCDLYQGAGELTGPGRGSAAGLLLTYLLEITHVDPIRYGLSMDRFMTKSRIESGKQPDIDQDLPHRDLLVDPEDDKKGWLRDRYGDCVAQISTDQTIKVRQGVLDVHRVTSPDRRVPEAVAKLAHQFAQPPQGIGNREFIFGYEHDGVREPGAVEWDPPLMEYVKKYPAEWETVVKCLGITRGKSRHACAYLVSNEPISNFIPLQTINGVTCTQLTAAQVESSGGLKMDFLIVNSLRDIAACIKMVQERSGDASQNWDAPGAAITINNMRTPLIRVIPHKGKYVDIWDPPEDQAVFRDICESNTESVFQFGTPGAQKWLKHFNRARPSNDGEIHKALDSIESLAAFTALDRPGPLDAFVDGPNDEHHNMLVEYARRARGEKPIGNFPLLDEMFPETYGVFCYQEQLTKLYQVLSGCSGAEADEFRVHISKKQKEKVFKDKATFMPGATARVGVEAAEKLWSMMETFSEYGFNKSVLGTTILNFEGGSKALKDFVGGETIDSVDENGNSIKTQVVALHDHGQLPGFEVTWSDGNTVTVSAQHKFLTLEGQKPLYDIVNRNLGVFSRSQINDKVSTASASIKVRRLFSGPNSERPPRSTVDNKMWNDPKEPGEGRRPPASLPYLSGHQEGEHSKEDDCPQHPSGAASSLFSSSQENFGSSRHSITAGSPNSRLAGGTSDRDSSYLGISPEGGQTIEDGGVATHQRNSRLERSSCSLWRNTKTSGFCESRSQDLGGGGRILALLQSNPPRGASSYPIPRCNAERRGVETPGCDVDQVSRELFQKLGREDGGRLAPVAYSDAPLAQTGSLVLRRIVRVRYVGLVHMYDLEVAHPKHNFLLSNGVVTSNSHAVCYVVIGYACAFLKHHYPLEWWTAVLRHAKKEELTEKFWKHCGHLIAMPDISRSRENFEIEGDKIRCPLTLMKGAGEAVQKELALYLPITSLEDLITKVDARRIKEGVPEVIQLKTKTKTVIHKARTNIGDGFMCKLITVGAADSLFPPEMCLLDRLQHYYKVACTIRGEINKKTDQPRKTVPKKYRELNVLEAFQLQKKLLPAFSKELFPTLVEIEQPGFRHTGRSWVYKPPGQHREYIVVSPEGLHTLENLSPWPHGQKHVVAFAAYVQSYERKRARADGRERAQVELDIAGEHRTWMLWPAGKEDRDIPVQYQRDLTGAIVMVLAQKYREDKPFSVQDLIVVQEPLSDKEEESPEVNDDE